ncbi:glycosyltransferase [Haloimpatiens sp. FM7330]|uniref:MGDG synthase family glycosyltransferase n=1 Tax=Haloimpatiens sp. FM7330 TaxID=3298610 RepID=UPI00362663A9
MNVLILTISAGAGHMKASEALKEYILSNDSNSKIEIIDTYKYINPVLEKILIGGYIKAIKKSPSLFKKLYNHTETDNSLAIVSTKINEILAFRLLPKIKDINPDIIISTHPFPNEIMSILKNYNELKIPTISLLTDYAPHSFWIRPGIDAYIISNDEMTYEMTLRGVNKANIFSYGIPVLPKFTKKYNRQELLQSLNLSPNKKNLLIMGGSLGIGKIIDVYIDLCQIDEDIQIIIITGNNKKLFNELKTLSKTSSKETKVIGYTEDVNKYMQCSDILITKPGGITITEALISHTPLALFSAIPGQEEKNAEFLLKHNLAITIEDFPTCKDAITSLLHSPNKLKSMKLNCDKFSKPNCGNDIYNLIKKITAQHGDF